MAALRAGLVCEVINDGVHLHPAIPAMVAERPGRLAFVTEEGLYVARGNALDDVTKLEGFDDARAVTVTDPNGDKIEDIAVADAAGLWLVEAQLR